MASRLRLYGGLAMLILAGLLVWRGITGNGRIRQLTSEIRDAYLLPDIDALFPITSLDEVIPEGSTPEEVVRKLQRLSDRVVDEQWVMGKDVGGSPFTAHIVALKLSGGGSYRVAFVYRDDKLWDIDTPDYLGTTSELPADSAGPFVIHGAARART